MLDLSSLPWYATVGLVAFSSVLTFFSTRLASKDNKKSDMLTQTMERQAQLDEAHSTMLKEYKEDYNRFRDEMSLMRQEIFEEKKKNNDLERKVDKLNDEKMVLQKENFRFQELVENMQKENEHLKDVVVNMQKENLQLHSLVDELKIQIKSMQKGNVE